jgi:hypothetical protein
MEDALWTQGIRKKSKLKRNRYEFQTDHGFRKWFKTRCEISGMKSINIEIFDAGDVICVGGHSLIKRNDSPNLFEFAGPSPLDPASYIYQVRGNNITIQASAYCFDNPPLR